MGAAKAAAKALSDEAKAFDAERRQSNRPSKKIIRITKPLFACVPDGFTENQNVPLDGWGEKPAYDFTPKPHWELAADLGIIDFERGARLSGSGCCLYWPGCPYVRALTTFFLNELSENCGYEEVLPPTLVRPEIMQGTGQLPKFGDQLYHCQEDNLYLIPTAEVPVTNLYGGEIFDADQLPKKMTAYTPCFRREAGAAGVGTRGIHACAI